MLRLAKIGLIVGLIACAILIVAMYAGAFTFPEPLVVANASVPVVASESVPQVAPPAATPTATPWPISPAPPPPAPTPASSRPLPTPTPYPSDWPLLDHETLFFMPDCAAVPAADLQACFGQWIALAALQRESFQEFEEDVLLAFEEITNELAECQAELESRPPIFKPLGE